MEWHDSQLETLEQCPICQSKDSTILYKAQPDTTFFSPGLWNLWQCHNCRAIYLNPRPKRRFLGRIYETYYTHTPTSDGQHSFLKQKLKELYISLRNDYLNHFYGYHFYPTHFLGHIVFPLFPWAERNSELKIRNVHYQSGAKLLDIGCGDGAYIQMLSRQGWQVVGLEPDEKAAKLAQQKGMEVHIGTLESVQFEDNSFDVITLNHVIEHLYDPVDSLKRVWHLLKPGGYVWLATPNTDSLGYQKYKKFWRGLEIPRHLVLFSSIHLTSILQELGFDATLMKKQSLMGIQIFRESSAIKNQKNISDSPPLPLLFFIEAIVADIISILNPQKSEFINVIGKKK
jgi:2-polyprenyl-3-methyl-5-hydroxy-6-metoxy-1,4-benzoquinol methylase